ncbi:hypothetical protein PybrP1_006965 [[Pythium] brassicae (nom. inval.)]|nr:hypothetical protein PybrP1_006965 [[Pythium] brassicae (nom. inval.)]
MAAHATNAMKYRYLGNSGLLVSTLSFGSWMLAATLPDEDKAYEILTHAFKHGINFFDNAEVYADGKAETLMGKCIQRGIDNGKVAMTAKLEDVAKEIGATLAQFSIAWCAANTNVSTVILGATSIKQLDENITALAFVDKITPEIRAKVEAIAPFVPKVVPQAAPFVHQQRTKYL